jgi:phosphoribosylformylglycinamidine synthase subunit PurQ / glutaminase
MTPNALVIRTAGTNCDRETVFALEQAGFTAERVHIYELMKSPSRLENYQMLVVPGGFSYGDDIAAGKILANELRQSLGGPLNEFVQADKCVLGICNGFQVLLKSGLLPGGAIDADKRQDEVTLGWNDSGQFIARWVHLRADSDRCIFLPKGEVITLPIAHGEGKFIPRDEAVLETLRQNDQLALRYVHADGSAATGEDNPNGSVEDIAGICDPSGRVFALMPHPERFVDITQHPQWTRGGVTRPDGQVFFQRAFSYLTA